MIVSLHGFLGRPHDWTALFQGHPLSDHLRPIDLFNDQPIADLWTWASAFNARLRAESNPDTRRILLGYSLGGRLAMHALLQDTTMWHGAIIVSSHLGLRSEEDKCKRKEIDDAWALRFESDPWDHLMNDWNSRDTFKNDNFHFNRFETDYSRVTLAKSLRNWSLSQQENLTERICQLKMPMLWLFGSDDITYVNQGISYLQDRLWHPASKAIAISPAGHRAPWQQPQKFLAELSNFINEIK